MTQNKACIEFKCCHTLPNLYYNHTSKCGERKHTTTIIYSHESLQMAMETYQCIKYALQYIPSLHQHTILHSLPRLD